MQPKITFCSRCRGMRNGWNRRYIGHCLICKQWLRKSSRFCGLIVIAAALLMAFPAPSATVFSSNSEQPVHELSPQNKGKQVDPAAVVAMQAFLKQHAIPEGDRTRLAESIVSSARKYNLNPRLLASVMIVESRGNQFNLRQGRDRHHANSPADVGPYRRSRGHQPLQD